MQAVGLDFSRFVDRPLITLSGGEKRRVAFASFLVVEPHILLLDEPFAGLDPLIHQELLSVVKKFKEDSKTVLLSTHSMTDLLNLVQKVIVLKDSTSVYVGDTKKFFQQPKFSEWGLEVPLELRLTAELRKKGWYIPEDLLSWGEILAWLKASLDESYHDNV